ncbi:MAG: hypothetical protein KGO94_10495 [Alphaproteobacteria bacterium]|nr:hypothetical protein [Alphaproteobacteria bacterium]
MQGQRYWVDQGHIGIALLENANFSVNDEKAKFSAGCVRITTGSLGTEVKWHVQTPCFSSLFMVMSWISGAQLPIVLRFYASGWFEEFHHTQGSAVRRIEDIVARGDRHFTAKTMIKQFEMKQNVLPNLLSECMQSPAISADYAVECLLEENPEQFTVQKIGPKSVISQVWGQFPSSFPCQPSGAYGQVVSEAYHEVVTTGKPRYDHVLAAMRMPDNALFWVPYHRLVMPKQGKLNKPTVLVIAELSQVDIQLI